MHRTPRSRHGSSPLLVLSAVWLVGVATPDLGRAAQPPVEGDYEVRVWAIRATNKNEEVSPKLKTIAEELRERTKFKGFKLEKEDEGAAKEGESFTRELLAGYKVKVTPLNRKDGRVQMKFEASRKIKDKDKPLIATTLTGDAGKFQLIALGKLDGDDQLIVAVSAK